MTLELSSGQIFILLVPQMTLFVSFVVYARVEISVIKQRVFNVEKQAERDKQTREKESDNIKDIYRDLNKKIESMQTLYSQQLYDINGKVTETAAYMKMQNNNKD